jgi:hypothetical protein
MKEGDDDVSWTAVEVLEQLNVARKTLREAQCQHKENRDKGLQRALEQQEGLVKDSDDPHEAKKAAKAIESLIRRHRTHETYAKIKRAMKQGAGGGLQWVDVPKRDEEGNIEQDDEGRDRREVLLEVDDIHRAILERNKQLFNQAHEMPFVGGAENMVLFDLLGYSGMSQAARDVVEGTFLERHGAGCDMLPEMEQLIKELAMPEEIRAMGKKIDCEITEGEFISGIRKWRESTSTSPSGRHLSLYKAIVNDPDLKYQDQDKAHLRV